MARRRNPTFVGLFCGCGGFDYGFEQSGFNGLGAFDNDPIAVATYDHNLKGKATQLDLASHELSHLSNVDVVVAGPPCQGFSTLGKRNSLDPRNALLGKAVAHAVSLKPRVIAIENVTGILSGVLSKHFENARDSLVAAGYHFRLLKITSDTFELPQIRKRIIMLAAKTPLDSIELPVPKGEKNLSDVLSKKCMSNHEPIRLNQHSKDYFIAKNIKPYQKLSNVRGGERAVPTWEIPEVFGSVSRKEVECLISIRKLRRQIRRRSFGDADPVSVIDIREHVGWEPVQYLEQLVAKNYLKRINKRFDFKHAFNGKFRRLSMQGISPAVDTRFGQPRYFLHPVENRGLSVREAARIQGFPDDFLFHGNIAQQHRLVGNAVSPRIGCWLANEIKEKLL